jgi:hypothetical protein
MAALKLLTFLIVLVTTLQLEGQVYITSRAFPIQPLRSDDEIILLNADSTSANVLLPCSKISFIDSRDDTSKLGYYPIYKQFPNNIRLAQNLDVWLKKQFETLFSVDDNSPRQLLVAVQKFWFSPEAYEQFSLMKQKLRIALYYQIEIYSRIGQVYYPQKKLKGSFSSVFREQPTYQSLADSLFSLLHKQLAAIKYTAREIDKYAIDSITLTSHYQDKKKNIPSAYIRRGVYASYHDFLNQKIIGDSVEIHQRSTESHFLSGSLGVYVNGEIQSCRNHWGYFDGRFLYVNTGNGLFMIMRRLKNQFVLMDLRTIALQPKKKIYTQDVFVGNSEYRYLKDFAKTYYLFYQLDLENGGLY